MQRPDVPALLMIGHSVTRHGLDIRVIFGEREAKIIAPIYPHTIKMALGRTLDPRDAEQLAEACVDAACREVLDGFYGQVLKDRDRGVDCSVVNLFYRSKPGFRPHIREDATGCIEEKNDAGA